MFKRAKAEVDGKRYAVCFDARTGEPLAIDVQVVRERFNHYRQIWVKNNGTPNARQILIIQAARDELEMVPSA
ncbi:hypothetical protein CPT_Maja_066 [Burkholderia phage Maja]|uniref:Uncharacterized protein n=1 Tax=Burkholderia phage Maja TaxID=2767571 RepID=A0A7S6U368_9CAUD|nr:hypothetical protein CPT_Maja_066 [Burkholderia phage Maja]